MPAADPAADIASTAEVGVPLEFSRSYTSEELKDLASQFHAKRDAVPDDGNKDPVLVKRTTSRTATVSGIFQCPRGGQISRSMRARATLEGVTSAGSGTVRFEDLLNVDSWSFGDQLRFHAPEIVENVARHGFCLSFGNTICGYWLTSNLQAGTFGNGGPGSTTVDLTDFDPEAPFMVEHCITISGGAGQCPTASSGQTQQCTRQTWSVGL
ncbi:hypothetical protein BGZ61DRAFT_593897 [Ilyonectria robusta]|uniref:uncharacterized protein n=1 Tax=Ilyonectria robusta TaxID=1079257 RepID=UPI001E8E4753|nr:uncharacterized protein BGZ61DRAFT_593897 [Ilyonectria robusta]KAH8659683.1 hypothetical protein BGZ61DRAFT_593897 [Ilyonectria robusta]